MCTLKSFNSGPWTNRYDGLLPNRSFPIHYCALFFYYYYHYFYWYLQFVLLRLRCSMRVTKIGIYFFFFSERFIEVHRKCTWFHFWPFVKRGLEPYRKEPVLGPKNVSVYRYGNTILFQLNNLEPEWIY